jgi:hypothetical protein
MTIIVIILFSIIICLIGVYLLLIETRRIRKWLGIGLVLITTCTVPIYTEWVNNRVFQYYTLKITLKDNTKKVIEYVKASELSIRFAEDSTITVCDTIPSVVKIELIEVKQKRYGEVHKNANF